MASKKKSVKGAIARTKAAVARVTKPAKRAATRAAAAGANAKPKSTARRPAASVGAERTARAGARAPSTEAASAKTAGEIAERLGRAIPEATCELRFRDAFELLIATILSAQSTDKMVNAVMPELLSRFPNAAALARAEQDEVEALVKRTGFFRNKAKAIRGAAQRLVEQHGGQVPRTLDELVQLPGVARKTANVVLGTAHRVPSGFVVDTHVGRVAQRLALSGEAEPTKIEQALCARFPKESWIDLGHRFVLHGRYTCLARAPLCESCPLNELCPSRMAEAMGPWAERAAAEAERVATGFRASGASA